MNRRVVLVTGASKGIGRSTASIFASYNCDVIINYNNSKDDANKLKEELESSYNVSCITIKCDISKENEVKEMVDFVISKFNKIDVLVNNASICDDCLLFSKTALSFKKVVDVNLIGTFIVSRYVGIIMKEQRFGNIINIASTNGIDTYYPESADYDASKAGIISLTHNFAKELAPNIRVNCICPGWVNTSMNENLSDEQIKIENSNILLNRFANSEEIAKVIYFVSSEDASYVNNSIIRVDGGKNV